MEPIDASWLAEQCGMLPRVARGVLLRADRGAAPPRLRAGRRAAPPHRTWRRSRSRLSRRENPLTEERVAQGSRRPLAADRAAVPAGRRPPRGGRRRGPGRQGRGGRAVARAAAGGCRVARGARTARCRARTSRRGARRAGAGAGAGPSSRSGDRGGHGARGSARLRAGGDRPAGRPRHPGRGAFAQCRVRPALRSAARPRDCHGRGLRPGRDRRPPRPGARRRRDSMARTSSSCCDTGRVLRGRCR